MKAYGKVDVYILVSLTPILVGEWSGSGLVLLTPGKSAPMLK
jgi:hypothetical protein